MLSIACNRPPGRFSPHVDAGTTTMSQKRTTTLHALNTRPSLPPRHPHREERTRGVEEACPVLMTGLASVLASSLATLAKTEVPGKDCQSNLAILVGRVEEAIGKRTIPRLGVTTLEGRTNASPGKRRDVIQGRISSRPSGRDASRGGYVGPFQKGR